MIPQHDTKARLTLSVFSTTMNHPYTGEELARSTRACPLPEIDVAFGDSVVWEGKPWVVNSMHYYAADGKTRMASLVRYGNDFAQASTAYAPIHELRVFSDAQPYTSA
jgi:hypothetical protein